MMISFFLTVVWLLSCLHTAVSQDSVWINELHYDNAGADVGEFIEVAYIDGIDITQYRVYLYRSNGVVFSNDPINDGTSDGAVSFSVIEYGTDKLFNTRFGIALVDGRDDSVVQFISYEGTFVANEGPAAGMSSTFIPVSENGSDPPGNSLQLIGMGCGYEDFTWSGPSPETKAQANSGQTLSCTFQPSVSPIPTQSPTESSLPSQLPTDSPTSSPSKSPSVSPTHSPTKLPTVSPTRSPTQSPTETPTHLPTQSPTEEVCPCNRFRVLCRLIRFRVCILR